MKNNDMRLTKKELMSVINQQMCFGSRLVGKKMFTQIIKELCEYKTIEEGLGIDLITLFKALKSNRVYSKHPETGEVSLILLPKIYYCTRKWNIGCRSMIFNEQEKSCDSWDCNPKDYGKTWALTREELENGIDK